MSQNPTQPTPLQRYSTLLTASAGIALLIGLVGVRSERAALNEVSFLSGEFIALMIGALILSGITAWAAFIGQLARWCQSRLLVGGWLVISSVGVILLPDILTLIRPYSVPLTLWLLLFDMAVILLAFAGSETQMSLGRVLRVVGLSALGILIPLLVLEIGLRLWVGIAGSERDKIAYIYTADQIAAQESALRGLPYINYGLSPTYEGHNSRGYRGPEIDTPKPAGTFRIVALGGSTTYGVDVAPHEAYPAQLERILHEEYGYTHVEVLNSGVAAYNSYDTFANFHYHVLDDEPDLVIVYHAINDVIARLVDPDNYNGLNLARGIWSLADRQLPASALIRFVGINLNLMPDPNGANWAFNNVADVVRCNDVTYCAQFEMTPQEVLDANPPVYFERNLRNLAAVALANDVTVVFSTWAYYPEPVNGQTYMTNDFVQNGVTEHNAIVQQLATDLNQPFYDLYTELPVDADYWLDGLHLTPLGTTEQARLYAAFLVENDLIPEPVN